MSTQEASNSNPKVTDAATWKKSASPTVELEVPSGNVCLVRKPDGMRVFMKQGMIPNSLMPMIQKAINEGSSGGEIQSADVMRDVLADPQKIADMMLLIDEVVLDTVVEPKVHPAPEEGDDRWDTYLYIDEVDMDDRMFIFNYAVGGTRDLERFRREQASTLGALPDGGAVEGSAE